MGLYDRLQHAWNAFFSRDPTDEFKDDYQPYFTNISSVKPDRIHLVGGNSRTMINAVYNRIAIDVAATTIKHIRTDENDRFVDEIYDGLDNCLTLEANKDQTARSFFIDVVMSMFDEGCVAIVPVDTTMDPLITGSYDIHSLRTGRILDWRPDHVRVRLYNDRTGNKEDLILPKKVVAIVENPFYSVMNESNSILKRLVRKLALLDAIDEQSGSGKLDLIIQLPYIIKTEARRQQAENRRKDIEMQLAGSKYGIAYTDGTERITQLNRPVENNLMKQIEYLTETLYSQLGITSEIMNGSADEKTMLNYYNRTIEPILTAIVDEMKRKFLTKTARTKGETIYFYRDPFKLVPAQQLAEIADKMTRNEIMSSNEFRQIIGLRPSDDPSADELRNKNLNKSSQEIQNGQNAENISPEEVLEPDE